MSDNVQLTTDKNGEICVVNTPANMRCFTQLSCSVQDLQRLFDQFLSGIVRERFSMMKGDKVMADQLSRRVEVAVKSVERIIQKEVEERVRELVAEKVSSIVAGMDFRVDVAITAKAEGGAA